MVRRQAVDYAIPMVTNIKVAEMLVDSLGKTQNMEIKSYQEHIADWK